MTKQLDRLSKIQLHVYWLGLWLLIAFFVTLLGKKPGQSVQAFWTPLVWAVTVPAAGLLAVLACRYYAQIKAFRDDTLTRRFVQLCFALNMAACSWNWGAKDGLPLYQCAAVIMLIFAVCLLCWIFTESMKRVRAWQSRRQTPIVPPVF